MLPSRRALLALASAGVTLSRAHAFNDTAPDERYRNQDCRGLEAEIQKAFEDLPERKSFKIWAPASRRAPEFRAQLHGNERFFSASANKAFILCERLRQLDSHDVEEKLVTRELKLDKDVWSIGSPVFNPPDLAGLVSERTAMEAMISHSDNTATDMILRQAGAEKVRKFIAAIGLKRTMIPDSTRALAGYLFGAPDYKMISWEELLSFLGDRFVHPALNDVETFASSADDFVSFYSRALQGRFFQNRQTLRQFRRILLLGDITDLVPFPIGTSVFGKAGYFDSPGQHARCVAGGMYFPDRWVYFATILNWDAEEVDDPKTVRAYFRATRRAIDLVRQAFAR
jgi:beta-lactamase class A